MFLSLSRACLGTIIHTCWVNQNEITLLLYHYGKKRENGNFKICSYLFFYVKSLWSYISPVQSSYKTVFATNIIVFFSEKLYFIPHFTSFFPQRIVTPGDFINRKTNRNMERIYNKSKKHTETKKIYYKINTFFWFFVFKFHIHKNQV